MRSYTSSDSAVKHLQPEQSIYTYRPHALKRATDQFLSSFRGRVENVIAVVGQSAAAMKQAAKTLLATSDHTLQRAEGAVHGSNEASANVETAAAAAEELSASIKEISRRLAQTGDVVRTAAADATAATWSSSFRTSPNKPICWR